MFSKLLAQNIKLPWEGAGDISVTGPSGFNSNFVNIGAIINEALTKYIFFFGGAGLLLMLIFAGFTYLTSAGDSKKMENAQHRITNALIGIILIITAYWLVQLAGTIFGLQGVNSIFNSGGGSSGGGSGTQNQILPDGPIKTM
jgi:hypothetical protein